MNDQAEDLELERGLGNVYADLALEDASARQLRAVLAAEIIKTLDAEGLTVREAAARTVISAADFSRIRQVRRERFTINRLMRIRNRLDQGVCLSPSVAQRPASKSQIAPLAAQGGKVCAEQIKGLSHLPP